VEIKLGIAVLIGATLAVGIGALVKYLIDH
jgi:hypothetical protein